MLENQLPDDQITTRKLIRKISLIIIGMVILLATIIIVEFKEFSNDYREYTIGTSDLGPRDLVWAGIMGTPPKYYESNTKYGLGYKEFETREIRKALEDAGFNLIYRYMSPNRLEFEFERKHPICFYDRNWSNPKEYFKVPHHPILSIPLLYTGVEKRRIFFRKGERNRFEKHLDSKGNINLTSLIKDKSLKTELIRAIDYDGPYARANITYGKKQLDGTYYDIIKDEYLKNIDLVILHTNDQILQMLERKRFDYQFYQTLEFDDYEWSKNKTNDQIETLVYEERSVNGIDDPNIIFHSVACGNHPLIKEAMPIINKVIYNVRSNPKTYDRNVKYAFKLDPFNPRNVFHVTLGGNSYLGKTTVIADQWYLKQFSINKMEPWPTGLEVGENSLKEKSKVSLKALKQLEKIENERMTNPIIPKWHLLEKKDKSGETSIFVINEVELKDKSDEKILYHSFLDKNYNSSTTVYLDTKEKFIDIDFSKLDQVKKLILFARDITDVDFDKLKPYYESKNLKSLTLIEPSPNQTKNIVKSLNAHGSLLEELRFYDVPTMGSSFGHAIRNLKQLKHFSYHSGHYLGLPFWMDKNEFKLVLSNLPKDLETFSIIGRILMQGGSSLPIEHAKIFSEKRFEKLKNLRIINFTLDDLQTKLIFDSLPLRLETLIIGATEFHNNFNVMNSTISSLVLEEFLNKRISYNKLNTLRISNMLFSLKENNKLLLPESIKDLEISHTIGLNDTNFHRIEFHPKLTLETLNLSSNLLSDESIVTVFPFLNKKMEELNVSKNKLTGKIFSLLKDFSRKFQFESLILESNPIDTQGMIDMSLLGWNITHLDISNMKFTDKSLEFLSTHTMTNLTSINLSDNHLSGNGINIFLQKYFKKLISLEMNNVLSLDIKKISRLMHDNLEVLKISGNLLGDDEMSILAKKLPKNLRELDVSGSRMGDKGALELVVNMPNLVKFDIDFRPGHFDQGFSFLLRNVSPYLKKFPNMNGPLNNNNAELMSRNMPPYLHFFTVPEFESEECNILLGTFPHSVRLLSIGNDIKSTGQSLKNLKEHFPSQLLHISWGNGVSSKERDTFLENLNYPISVSNMTRIDLTYPYIKLSSLYNFQLNGGLSPQAFKDIVFPPVTVFFSNIKDDYPKGLFYSFKKLQLNDLTSIALIYSSIDFKELIDLLKKIPPTIRSVALYGIGLKPEHVDKIIEVLPRNLRFLGVGGNPIGEEGLKKFYEFKTKMEEKTGLPFQLTIQ